MSQGCLGRVSIIDSEWCGDIGQYGAVCFHTLTTAQRDIPKEEWDSDRFGMICTKSAVFANWKEVIEQLCSASNDCDYATKQQLNLFFERVKNFQIRQELLLQEQMTHH